MTEFETRALAVKERNKTLCSVPGSGYHDNDVSSPQKKGEPALRDHIVVFHEQWEHVFAGECAAKAKKALADFADENAHILLNETSDPSDRTMVRAAKEYAAKEITKDGLFTVRNQQWNDVQRALSLAGVGVTSTALRG